MTPDEIVSKFLVALDNFEPITDQPSDSDLTRLREAIALLPRYYYRSRMTRQVECTTLSV